MEDLFVVLSDQAREERLRRDVDTKAGNLESHSLKNSWKTTFFLGVASVRDFGPHMSLGDR